MLRLNTRLVSRINKSSSFFNLFHYGQVDENKLPDSDYFSLFIISLVKRRKLYRLPKLLDGLEINRLSDTSLDISFSFLYKMYQFNTIELLYAELEERKKENLHHIYLLAAFRNNKDLNLLKFLVGKRFLIKIRVVKKLASSRLGRELLVPHPVFIKYIEFIFPYILMNKIVCKITGLGKQRGRPKHNKILIDTSFHYSELFVDYPPGFIGINNSVMFLRNFYLEKFKLVYDEIRRIGLSSHLDYLCSKTAREEFSIGRTYSSVLIISHQGVGDEIRKAALFNQLNASLVTIVIDPRLIDVLKTEYPKFNFIPFKAERPGLVRVNHVSSLKDVVLPVEVQGTIDTYDLVMTSGEFYFSSYYQLQKKKGVLRYKCEQGLLSKSVVKIGIIWRSDFCTQKRLEYYFKLHEFIEIFSKEYGVQVQLSALVSNITKAEQRILNKYSVKTYQDVDIYNDFLGLKNILKGIDYVVGISSFASEFAAYLGVKTYFLATNSKACYMRTGLQKRSLRQVVLADNITLGAVVITANSYGGNRKDILKQLVENTKKEIKEDISRRIFHVR